MHTKGCRNGETQVNSYDKHENRALSGCTTDDCEKNKRADALPKMIEVGSTFHLEMKRCGKENCRCVTLDQLHGPYAYVLVREMGRLRKRYVRQADVPAVQALYDAQATYKAQQRQARQSRRYAEQEAREEYRRLIGQLRHISGDVKP
jgi:hypothetical protein